MLKILEMKIPLFVEYMLRKINPIISLCEVKNGLMFLYISTWTS